MEFDMIIDMIYDKFDMIYDQIYDGVVFWE